MTGVRIDELPGTVAPAGDHNIPAMKEGQTVKLTLQQIVDLAQNALTLDFLSDLPESTDHTDLPVSWGLGGGIGLFSDEFRFFLLGDTNDSLRIERGSVRIRSEAGAAALRLRRTETNTSGNLIGVVLASGVIPLAGGGTDERLFGRIRFIIDDADEVNQRGALELTLINGHDVGTDTEVEVTIVEALPDLWTHNTVVKYGTGITPTENNDHADIQTVRRLIEEGGGTPYPISISIADTVVDPTEPYTLIRNAPHPFTVASVDIQADGAGSGTVIIQKNGSAVTGWGSLAASSALSTTAAPNDGTQDFAAGNSLSIDLSGFSNLSNLNIDIKAFLNTVPVS